MKAMLRLAALLAATLVLGGCVVIERLAIPDKKLIDPKLGQSGAEDMISHASWDAFLQAYSAADSQGVVRINYAAVSPEHRESLKRYIAQLSTVALKSLTKDAQLAYWANLYNAATVDVILDHYPVSSIRKVKDGLLDIGPWGEKRLTLNGRPTSLHDIEHGIVRPLWSDTPEIHYILNCGAVGCPNLAQQAYTGDNVQNLMRQAASAYVNDPQRGVRMRDDGTLTLSKIYAWYRGDFGGSDAGILEHLRVYAAPTLKARLDADAVIRGYSYDWSLNDVEP
jgi:hypothetical protein